jgi:hypothetical protein
MRIEDLRVMGVKQSMGLLGVTDTFPRFLSVERVQILARTWRGVVVEAWLQAR